MLQVHKVPFFAIDWMTWGLQHGAPTLGIASDGNPAEKAGQLWPVLRPMLEVILQHAGEYLVEGDALLPQYAAELRRDFKDRVRICFLGFAETSVERKLREIRTYASPNDWTNNWRDEELASSVEFSMGFSRLLAEQCTQHGIRFFDTSSQFDSTVRSAVAYLRRDINGDAPSGP